LNYIDHLVLPNCRQPLPWDYFRLARDSTGIIDAVGETSKLFGTTQDRLAKPEVIPARSKD